MKTCEKCGKFADIDITNCVQCGTQFPTMISNYSSEKSRPTGEAAKIIGAILVTIGSVAFVFSFLMSATSYDGSLDPSSLSWKWTLTWFGAGLFHLGLLIWLVGYIVHSISFLPGKGEE